MPEARILVVEDEAIIASDLKNRLERLGYQVSAVVASGEEAVSQAGEIQPDLVLMDIGLRGAMDGVEAAEEIRVRFDVPVIYLTAYADDRTLERARITEPFGYLVKPFRNDELRSAIEVALYRHRVDEKLKESEAKFRALLEAAPTAVVITDEDGRIELVNAETEEMFGFDRDELLGQTIEILLPECFRGVHVDHRAVYLSAPYTRPMGTDLNLAGRRKDGTEFSVEVGLSSIETGDGVLVMSFVSDTTERQRVEKALRESEEKLRSTISSLRQQATELHARNEELDAFAHTVAHDLKNPLGIVSGFAEILEDTHATSSVEELEEYLHIIAWNSRKMANIVDELLLLAGVRSMEVERMPLDMASIVADAQQRLADMIEQRQAEILSPSAWPVALGYGPWIEEVWVNYLSNAVKYGGQPPRAELGAEVQTDGMVRFWVRDNGPGLTPGEQSQLFVPFTKLAQIHVEGHGLGLSIVRRIVKKLGGQVGVESDGVPGRGSVFYFTLPGTQNQ